MILAIDQGTTSTRAFLLDESGRGTRLSCFLHRQIYPQPGWVEHDPEEIYRNLLSCIDSCKQQVVIGLDNQGESCLAWDAETKEAISPILVWQDARTAEQVLRLKKEGLEPLVMARAGLPLDPYFSAAKLGWIYSNIPKAKELHRKKRLRLGTCDAFFLDRLTGNFMTDLSTASRTSLMDFSGGSWDAELCELFGVPLDCLPEIVATTGDFGSFKRQGRRLQIRASVVDQQAALYGHGCIRPGDLKITFGTGAFVLALTGKQPVFAQDQGLLPTVAWRLAGEATNYALDGGVFAAGSAINWAKSLGLFADYAELNHFTDGVMMDRGLAFVPALAGLGSPYYERTAGGAWIGLGLDTTSSMLVQSILEGIAFRTAEVVAAMSQHCSLSGRISIDGGLSANPFFCQFLADLLETTVVVKGMGELTSFGTARLAGAGPVTCAGAVDQEFFPCCDRKAQLKRYRDAVQRSRNWHL